MPSRLSRIDEPRWPVLRRGQTMSMGQPQAGEEPMEVDAVPCHEKLRILKHATYTSFDVAAMQWMKMLSIVILHIYKLQ